MAVRISIPVLFREFAGGQQVIEAEAGTLEIVLSEVLKRFPSLNERIMRNGTLKPFVVLFLNGKDYRAAGGMKAVLVDGDELSIIGAISGG